MRAVKLCTGHNRGNHEEGTQDRAIRPLNLLRQFIDLPLVRNHVEYFLVKVLIVVIDPFQSPLQDSEVGRGKHASFKEDTVNAVVHNDAEQEIVKTPEVDG